MATAITQSIFEYVVLGFAIWVLYELIMLLMSFFNGKGGTTTTTEPEIEIVTYDHPLLGYNTRGKLFHQIPNLRIIGKNLHKLPSNAIVEFALTSGSSTPPEAIFEKGQEFTITPYVRIKSKSFGGKEAMLVDSSAGNLVSGKKAVFDVKIIIPGGGKTYGPVKFELEISPTAIFINQFISNPFAKDGVKFDLKGMHLDDPRIDHIALIGSSITKQANLGSRSINEMKNCQITISPADFTPGEIIKVSCRDHGGTILSNEIDVTIRNSGGGGSARGNSFIEFAVNGRDTTGSTTVTSGSDIEVVVKRAGTSIKSNQTFLVLLDKSLSSKGVTVTPNFGRLPNRGMEEKIQIKFTSTTTNPKGKIYILGSATSGITDANTFWKKFRKDKKALINSKLKIIVS